MEPEVYTTDNSKILDQSLKMQQIKIDIYIYIYIYISGNDPKADAGRVSEQEGYSTEDMMRIIAIYTIQRTSRGTERSSESEWEA